MNESNRSRAFAETVSVEAWHEPFANGVTKSNLYADVVFGTAAVGAENESPVRFRLSVKRAEFLVILPRGEPVLVNPASVARDGKSLVGERTTTMRAKTEVGGSSSGQLSLSLGGGSASGNAGFAASSQVEKLETMETRETLALTLVVQSKDGDGNYKWEMSSRNGSALADRPWDPTGAPRLQLVDTRKDPNKGIPPTVRIEVRCRREDLIIEDIQFKDQKSWVAQKLRRGHKARMAAVMAYIRKRLAEEGLQAKNIDDPFGLITLNSTTAAKVPE